MSHPFFLSYRRIPIFVRNSLESFYLMDLLLPANFDENIIRGFISIITSLRSNFAKQNEIDRTLAEFYQMIPFYLFNSIYVLEKMADDKNRISLTPVKELLVGAHAFPITPIENDNLDLCLKLCSFYTTGQ